MTVHSGSVKAIFLTDPADHIFELFPCFIQQFDVLRILDILRSTGRIKDQCSGVFRFIGFVLMIRSIRVCISIMVVIIAVIIVFLCIVFDDHFVDLVQHIFRKALSEFDQQRRHKRDLVLVSGQTDEILIVRVFSDLFNQFLIGIVILLLDQKRTECHPKRLCRHTGIARKQFCIFSFNCFPRNHLCFFDPAVIRIHYF